MKKSWRFAKAAEAGSKERQTVAVKFRGERKRIIKEIRDVQAAKKIAMESTSKVANVYDAKVYKLKKKFRNQLLITLFLLACYHFYFKVELNGCIVYQALAWHYRSRKPRKRRLARAMKSLH